VSDRQRAIYIAANSQQAHLLRNLLADAGIEAFVSNDTLNSVHFEPMDWLIRAAGAPGFAPTAPKLVVHEEDAEEAREIVLAAETQLLEGGSSPELVQLETETGEEQAWPLCPHCARARLATCPVCETSGTNFAPAFLPDEEEGQEPSNSRHAQVLCNICDEPFVPRFPARCEWCGHRFADGYETKTPEPLVTHPVVLEELGGRAGIVIAAMAALTAGILGWFWYGLR
jgi:hypothetical protein